MFALGSPERRTFRLSGDHVVVLFDRLTRGEQERFAPLRRDPEFYGIVRRRDGMPGTTMLAASRDVALLLLTLQQPGPLPLYFTEHRSPAVDRAIEQLVLDGVLEVECDGVFVSGAAILATAPTAADSEGRIAQLSRDALRYASALDTSNANELEARLYTYNQMPLTPRWSERIPTAAAVRLFLGLDQGPTATLLNRSWDRASAARDAWIQWISDAAPERQASDSEPTYKLYVSPTLDAFPFAFATAVRVFSETAVSAFKVGATPRDVARPDKLVAYFRTRERALECGEILSSELAGTPVQGVPFSADIGGDGLVTWGMDPPDRRGRAPESSWRRWVCRRLARYLSASSSASDRDVPPWRYALERIRLDGVDPARWEPVASQMTPGEWSAQ